MMSYVLRHNPQKFNLKLDSFGFVEIDGLIKALKTVHPWINAYHIREVVKTCPKGRFEIKGNKIRARYGHSQPVKQSSGAVSPPELLYHGTSRGAIEKIKRRGILSMNRQKVHLSKTRQEAYNVGLRKDNNPVILRINAQKAFQDGIKFFQEGNVFLAEKIPPEYLT